MVLLEEILDEGRLAEEIGAGYVSARHHPDDPELVIYNYTNRAQFENRWNDVTMHARGLIACRRFVVARGWKKFFNYGQEGAPYYAPAATVVALDKIDGSLGIAYRAPDSQWAIATRGSFVSEQAIHATDLLRSRPDYLAYLDRVPRDAGFTPLFEIVYPENRIVVDYEGQDDLVGIGTAHLRTGRHRGFLTGTPWPTAEQVLRGRFIDTLALSDRKGKEGLVVVSQAGEMVKLKQEDYLELHRIVTGLSERTVWEAWVEGRHEALITSLPDEWQPWAAAVAADLTDALEEAYSQARNAYETARAKLADPWDRKEFALAIKDRPDSALLFLLRDGRTAGAIKVIKKSLRPKGPQAREREEVLP